MGRSAETLPTSRRLVREALALTRQSARRRILAGVSLVISDSSLIPRGRCSSANASATFAPGTTTAWISLLLGPGNERPHPETQHPQSHHVGEGRAAPEGVVVPEVGVTLTNTTS